MAITAAVASLVALASIGSAQAAVAPQPGPRHATMYLGGIDAAQAAAAGNVVRVEGQDRLLIDGQTGEVLARVPADPALARTLAVSRSLTGASAIVTPNAYSDGTCGDSWVDLWEINATARSLEMETGFDLAGSYVAIDVAWSVRFTEGAKILGYWSASSLTAPTNYWAPPAVSKVYASSKKLVTAKIITGHAIMEDGQVCYSGLPSETMYW